MMSSVSPVPFFVIFVIKLSEKFKKTSVKGIRAPLHTIYLKINCFRKIILTYQSKSNVNCFELPEANSLDVLTVKENLKSEF